MRPWRICQYEMVGGFTPVMEWYRQQEPYVQAATRYFWGILEATEDWLDPQTELVQLLTKAHAPLYEIRFHAHDRDAKGRVIEKRRIRIVGMLRADERDFIAFGAAEELRNGMYKPADAFDKALARYRAFIDGKGDVYELF